MNDILPSRRQALISAGSAAAVLTQALPAAKAATGEKPNILWLVSEDNNPRIGAYGDTLAHTPNIDALAARGIVYRHAYSNAPVCAPSRFAILTGLHPETCAPANQMRAVAHLPKDFATYPELLRKAGYYCTNNAKTDYNCDVDPKAVWDESSRQAHWRNRRADQPFMAVFNHETSHEMSLFQPAEGRVSPDQVRIPAYLPDTAAIRQDFATYYNRIEQMDAQIGERLKELEAAGLAEDTIVFYYSDNGGTLPRSKRYCYEEGLRTALVVSFPPKWAHLAPAPAGSTVEAPITLIDLPLTVLALAGIEPPAQMQGRSLLTATGARYAFGMRNRMDAVNDFVRSVTDTRWRYIRNYLPHWPAGRHVGFAWLAKGYQSWDAAFRAGKLNEVQQRFFLPRTYEELYDLQADPDQVVNLADRPEHQATRERLSQALDAHMLRIHDNGFLPEGLRGEGYFESRNEETYPLKSLMALAELAGQRQPRNRKTFEARLRHANAAIRYWAATGLLILGEDASGSQDALRGALAQEDVPQVRVSLADALIRAGDTLTGAAALSALLDPSYPWQVRLQVLNALTALSPRVVLPAETIRQSVGNDEEYLLNAAQYLLAINDGSYDPAKPLFDLDALVRRFSGKA